jgi:hypothetical protein
LVAGDTGEGRHQFFAGVEFRCGAMASERRHIEGDNARVETGDRWIIEPERAQTRRRKARDDDVGATNQRLGAASPHDRIEVERDRTLAAIEDVEVRRPKVLRASRRFDPDRVGTMLRQQHPRVGSAEVELNSTTWMPSSALVMRKQLLFDYRGMLRPRALSEIASTKRRGFREVLIERSGESKEP